MRKWRRFYSVTLACIVAAAACGSPSPEVISAKNIMGTVSISAEDGTAGPAVTKAAGAKKVPVDDTATKGKSKGVGHVGDWNTATCEANADIGAPVAARKHATVTTTSVATSSFDLKNDGRKVVLTVDSHFKATLNSGKATIEIKAAIAQTAASLTATYTLEVDPNDATGKTIKITGTHVDTMKNGGASMNYTEKAAAAAQATLNKGSYSMSLTVTVTSDADTQADVTVDTAKLSLPAT